LQDTTVTPGDVTIKQLIPLNRPGG